MGGGGKPGTHCACVKIPAVKFKYIAPSIERKLSVTLVFISPLQLFATLTGACLHGNSPRQLLLMSWLGSRADWKPKFREKDRDLAIGNSAGLAKSSSLFEVSQFSSICFIEASFVLRKSTESLFLERIIFFDLCICTLYFHIRLLAMCTFL